MEKKLETVKLIAKLEQATRKTENKIWKDLAERLSKPKRNNIVVNVDKLDKLSKLYKGKTLIVPGKILSVGEFSSSSTIVGVNASEKAVEKISSTGKYIPLTDFVSEKVDVKNLIIIK